MLPQQISINATPLMHSFSITATTNFVLPIHSATLLVSVQYVATAYMRQPFPNVGIYIENPTLSTNNCGHPLRNGVLWHGGGPVGILVAKCQPRS